MTVLVTGGAGYIGSHMVLELLDAGENVVVLDNLSTGFRWAVPARTPTSSWAMSATMTSCAGCIAAIRIDAIIHFAGSIVVPESVADPLGYYHNNTVKSRALIDGRSRDRRPAFHLLLDRRRLRHAEGQPGRRGRATRRRCRPTGSRS